MPLKGCSVAVVNGVFAQLMDELGIESRSSAGGDLSGAGRTRAIIRHGRAGCFMRSHGGQARPTLLLGWDRFRRMLPIGANFDDLKALEYAKSIGKVSALLLADYVDGPINPVE